MGIYNTNFCAKILASSFHTFDLGFYTRTFLHNKVFEFESISSNESIRDGNATLRYNASYSFHKDLFFQSINLRIYFPQKAITRATCIHMYCTYMCAAVNIQRSHAAGTSCIRIPTLKKSKETYQQQQLVNRQNKILFSFRTLCIEALAIYSTYSYTMAYLSIVSHSLIIHIKCTLHLPQPCRI